MTTYLTLDNDSSRNALNHYLCWETFDAIEWRFYPSENPQHRLYYTWVEELKHKCTWSDFACPSMSSTPFCLHKSLVISPNLRRTLP